MTNKSPLFVEEGGCDVVNESYEQQEGKKSNDNPLGGKATVFSCAANLANTVIGAGMLGEMMIDMMDFKGCLLLTRWLILWLRTKQRITLLRDGGGIRT